MFAYCGNNPVVNIDPTGDIFGTLFDIASLGYSIYQAAKNPDDPMAKLAVVADAASLLLPMVSGGGAAVRAGANANKFVEATIKYGDEIKLPRQIKYEEAVDAWDSFLGSNQTNYSILTGKTYKDRIFSADGKRSIRFGNHEMDLIGKPKAHFHYEIWDYDESSNTIFVHNYLQRMR